MGIFFGEYNCVENMKLFYFIGIIIFEIIVLEWDLGGMFLIKGIKG